MSWAALAGTVTCIIVTVAAADWVSRGRLIESADRFLARVSALRPPRR